MQAFLSQVRHMFLGSPFGERAEIRELVGQAVIALSQASASEQLARTLAERTGRTRDEAWDALVLVPIAFGRVLFETWSLRFVDTYVLQTSQGESEKRLFDSEVYRAAIGVARKMRKRGPRSDFEAIAKQGPEFNAINNALNSGLSVEELSRSTFGPPVIWR